MCQSPAACDVLCAAGSAEVLSKEVRVTRFKQLLLEGGVNAFSLYAKVKAKLDKDER